MRARARRTTGPVTLLVLAALAVLAGCGGSADAGESERIPEAVDTRQADAATPPLGAAASASANPDTAWFAGGCFWCMEPPFDDLDGVLATISGFMGGSVENPTYEQVVAGGTGHAEIVQVIFDPARISYPELLDVYWVNTDPLDAGGQFCDRGPTYRPEIFARPGAQFEQAVASRDALEASGRFDRPIVTRITERGAFYPAEEYHQDYYQKNPIRYRVYRTGCGRDRRLGQLWGD
jgi:peptide-methionine (S)-S-oxide reductase